MKTITLQYITVNFIDTVLSKIKLEGQLSFARRRFLRELKPHIQDLEAEQKELQQKFVEKNTKGELKVDGNSYVFTAQNRKIFNRKWDELGNGTVDIEVNDANEKDIIAMKEVLVKEADRYEQEDAKNQFNASAYEYVTSIREGAEALTIK